MTIMKVLNRLMIMNPYLIKHYKPAITRTIHVLSYKKEMIGHVRTCMLSEMIEWMHERSNYQQYTRAAQRWTLESAEQR